jgi:hypothetical protein
MLGHPTMEVMLALLNRKMGMAFANVLYEAFKVVPSIGFLATVDGTVDLWRQMAE